MCHKIIIFNKNNYRDSRTLESITQQLMQPIALQYTTDFITMQPIANKKYNRLHKSKPVCTIKKDSQLVRKQLHH